MKNTRKEKKKASAKVSEVKIGKKMARRGKFLKSGKIYKIPEKRKDVSPEILL